MQPHVLSFWKKTYPLTSHYIVPRVVYGLRIDINLHLQDGCALRPPLSH